MNRLTLDLLWCMVQVTLLSGAASVVYFVIRRQSVQLRTALLQTTFVLVGVLSLLALSPWPRWWPTESSAAQLETADALRQESRDSKAETESVGAAAPEGSTGARLADVELESPARAFLAEFARAIRTPPAADTKQSRSFSWSGLFCAVMIGMIMVRLSTLVVHAWQVARLRRTSTQVTSAELLDLRDLLRAELNCTATPDLRISDRISTAAATGSVRPVILLSPAWKTWTPGQLRGILAHEMAHVRAHDPLAVLLSELALAFHFYHPVLHWLSRRFQLEQEFQADATAALSIGGEQPYLRILAQLALSQSPKPTPGYLSTFLTTQSPLLRRIEMLKQPHPARTSGPLRLGMMGVMVLLGLAVVGLRTPERPRLLAQDATSNTVAQQDADTGEEPVTENTLAWVPQSTLLLLHYQLDQIRQQQDSKALLDSFDAEGFAKQAIGLSTSEIRRLQIVTLDVEERGADRGPGRPRVGLIIHSTEPMDSAEVLRNVGIATEYQFNNTTYYALGQATHVAFPAPRVMLWTSSGLDTMHAMVRAGSVGASESQWSKEWEKVSGSLLGVLVRSGTMREFLERELMPGGPTLAGISMLSPLWRDADVLTLRLDSGEALQPVFRPAVQPDGRLTLRLEAGEALQLRAEAVCNSEEGAARVRETLQAATVLAKNSLAGMKRSLDNMPPQQREMFANIIAQVEAILKEVEPKQQGNRVTIAVQASQADVTKVVASLLPAITAARTAAKRMQSMNNLKQIALAFHNYHDMHRQLPPAVVIGPDGKTPHSWRIALLPFLEERELYEQYRMNEPWDSEHNKQLLQRMPAIYRHPMDAPGSTDAGYFVLVGDNSLFGKPEGTHFRNVTDGLSNTLMAVSARRNIPWTKPEDILYDAGQKIPDFGGFFDEGYEAVLADGSVRFITKMIDENTLRRLITINDGQPNPELP